MVIDFEEEDKDLEFEALVRLFSEVVRINMLDYDENHCVVPDSQDSMGIGWLLASIVGLYYG